MTDDVEEDVDKFEVFESLQTHKNLMEIDSQQNLKLKNRHVGVTEIKGIKGYPLSNETLRIAVPVINLMIYVNPVFAYLLKPAIVAVCIDTPSKGTFFSFLNFVLLFFESMVFFIKILL